MNARLFVLCAVSLLIASCATVGGGKASLIAQTALFTSTGSPAGTATIESVGGKLSLGLAIAGLTPGEHGMHLHAISRCEGPTFASAGGHLNPENRQHGSKNSAGAHLGDLPNVTADANGRVAAIIPLGELQSELEAALFDADGTALVIHATADDYRTNPSGNSGARIACGVLTSAR